MNIEDQDIMMTTLLRQRHQTLIIHPSSRQAVFGWGVVVVVDMFVYKTVKL